MEVAIPSALEAPGKRHSPQFDELVNTVCGAASERCQLRSDIMATRGDFAPCVVCVDEKK